MASAKNEAKIKFIAETTEFNQSIQAANQKMTELRSEMKLVNAQFGENANSVEALTEKQRILKEQQDAAAQKVEALRQKLEKAKEIYGENSEEVSKLKTQLNNAETQYVKLGNEIEDCNKALNTNEEQVQDVADEVDDLTDSTKKGSEGWTTYKGIIADLASTALKKLAEGLKNVAAAVVETGSDFEAGMSRVEAVSGATASEMERLEAKAREMGETTKFTASDSADAFNYMAMAGWKASDMIDGISGVMYLAAAAGADLATTSDIVTDTLTAMGASAKESGRLADIMAAAASNSNTNVEMMGETFKYVAPLAGTLNYSMEDLALATGLMANAGIKSSTAGTSMRQALSNLLDPSEKASNLMQELGFYTEQTITTFDQQSIDRQMLKVEKATLSLDKAQSALNKAVAEYGEDSEEATFAASNLAIKKEELRIATESLEVMQKGETDTVYGLNEALLNEDGSMKSLRDTLYFLRDRFADLSEAEQAEAASAIFGQRAMSGMLAIINASDDDFEALASAIDGSKDAAYEMSKVMQDNLQGDVTLLKSAAQELALQLYEKVQPVLRGIVQFTKDSLLPVLGWIIDNLPTVGTIIAGIIATIIAYNWSSIITFIGNVSTAVAGLFTTLIANPIGLVVSAVAALAAGLVYLCTRTSEADKAIQSNAESVTAFGQAVSAATPNLVHATDMLSAYGNSMSELDGMISETESAITTILKEALSEQRQLRDDEIASIEQHNQRIAELNAEKLDTYRQAMVVEQMKIAAESNAITQEEAAQYVANLKQGLAEANAVSEESYNARLAQIHSFHQANGTLYTEAYYAEVEAARQTYETELADNQAYLTEGMMMLTENAAKVVQTEEKKWSDVSAARDDGKKAYRNALSEMNLDTANAFLSMLTETVSKGGEISAETAQLAIDMISSFDDLPKKMQESGKNALLGMTSGLESQIPALENASDMSAQEIVDTMKGALGITGTGQSMVMANVGKNVATGLASGIAAGNANVETASKGMANTVTNTTAGQLQVNSPSRVMYSIGGYVAEGLARGIEDKRTSIGQRVANFASGLISKIKGAFGVASPSKVMMEIGGYLSEGLGIGIEDNAYKALKPMQNLADGLTGGLNGSIDYSVNSSLGDFVSSAISANSPMSSLSTMIDAIEDLASRAIELNIDGTRFATATASASDTVSGNRLNLKNRGLAL